MSIDSQLQHGFDFHADSDLVGFTITEKFDGVRAYFDGENLITRQGKLLNPPAWFVQDLPKTPLDCELWAGYGRRSTVNALMASKTPAWASVKLMVFDAPDIAGDYMARNEFLDSLYLGEFAQSIPASICFSFDGLCRELDAVLARGGEGLVCYKPGREYLPGRSNAVVKVKPQFLAKALPK